MLLEGQGAYKSSLYKPGLKPRLILCSDVKQ